MDEEITKKRKDAKIEIVTYSWRKSEFRKVCYENNTDMSQVMNRFIPYYLILGEELFYLLEKFQRDEAEKSHIILPEL